MVCVELASYDEADAVVDVLAEASAWLASKGIHQWPARFEIEFIQETIKAGTLYVVKVGGRLAGTVTLQWSDPMFWGERDDAAFIHRLAIRRSHAGLGREVVAWAESEALSSGRRHLCLDTLSSNVRLRRYYEDLGFRPVGEVKGPSAHSHTEAHGTWTATLYEKALVPSLGRRPT